MLPSLPSIIKVPCPWLLLSLLPSCLAHPKNFVPRDSPKFEWTALGDSYASGVGSTSYVDGRRCLRYDSAWPVLLNKNPNLAKGDEYIFNNVPCSGAHYNDVEDYQFYDKDQQDQPNWEFTPRPKFGTPAIATLAVGGDDIDFPGILFNCILEANLWVGGPPHRTCDDQRAHSWSLIKDPKLVDNIDGLIKKTVTKGRKGPIKDKFKMYVTGYGEFFNATTPLCDDITFARSANPKDDGKEHTKLTKSLRQDFNKMSLGLNAAIQAAVARNADHNVKYIDINAGLDGHRFCEKGIKEPDQDNQNLWFWHYPYNTPSDATITLLENAASKLTAGMSIAALSAKYPNGDDYNNAIMNAVSQKDFQAAADKDPKAKGHSDIDAYWGWDSIGWRAKVFHPQVAFHQHIADLVAAQYQKDKDDHAVSGPPSNPCGGNGDNTPACPQGHLPTLSPYSGIQPPVCNKDDSGTSPLLRINDGDAKKAANSYCAALASAKVVLDAKATPPKAYISKGGAEKGGNIALGVLFDVGACPTDKSSSTVDFTKMTLQECYNNFYVYISEMCAQDKTWSTYDPQHTLEGGVVANDCGIFSLSGQQA